jgi:hypothetical protein
MAPHTYLVCPEDGGNTFLRIINKHSPEYTASEFKKSLIARLYGFSSAVLVIFAVVFQNRLRPIPPSNFYSIGA